MANAVLLPQWSMGMQDGEVLRWLKQPGDAVTRGEVLAEVESSKTVGEVVADRDGVFLAALVAPGQVVAVRTPLCMIGAPGETWQAAPPPAATTSQPAPAPASAPAPVPTRAPAAGARVEITPVARKLAKDRGVNLADVAGSGPGGRIVEADVRAVLHGTPGRTYTLAGPRAVIADRMTRSLAHAAQITLSRELDVTALASARGTLGATWGDLIGYAASRVLPAHGHLNGTVDGNRVRLADDVDMGFAVALEDALLVPVIRAAQRLSLAELATTAKDLARRARAGTLSGADLVGGSFTLSNLGAYGIDAFTPIINPPQIAILGIGRVRETPAREADALVWRHTVVASLTFDHRVTDGAPAAAFLRDLADFLATPAGFA